MMNRMQLRTQTSLVAIALAMLCGPSMATTAAKGKDRVQTREELRVCLALKDSNASTRTDLNRRQSEHEAKRASLRTSGDGLTELKASVDAAAAAYKLTDEAIKAHSSLISKWNEEMTELSSSTMKSAERRKEALRKDKVELDSRNQALMAERNEKVKAYDKLVAQYNDRVKAAQQVVADWNDRTASLQDEANALRDKELDYAETCANRRFREEDEQAIRKGAK